MKRREDDRRRLDRLLLGVEDSVLGATERELVADKRIGAAKLQELRSLVGGSLKRRQDEKPSGAAVQSGRVAETVAPLDVPTDPVGQRRLLEMLLASRSDVRADLRAAFSGQRKLSDRDVSEYISRLMRAGFVSAKKG